ncbi:hypothetical protein SCHPADRAFT_244838 [Schizopora paradoxa]|uniref:Uncharacterized protein n=1 Tax=Schizopora paradoxa TaxID=27342 RepID=A0A0H2RW25_9AGAM|nr:hypothetical protein SCHPADRAFT_244838 [Schizopora paradoxa]
MMISSLVRIPGIIGVICQAIIAALLIIRTYAIYEKSLRILLLLVLVGIPSVVFSMNALIKTDTLHEEISNTFWGDNSAPVTLSPNLTCFLVPSLLNKHQSLSRFEKSFIVTIAFDTLIFLLAFSRMIQTYKFSWSRSNLLKPSFSMVLLRDGCILFAALLVSHVNNLAFFESSWNNFDGSPSALRNPFNHVVVVSSGTNCELTHAISVVLVSRMVFNLREIGTEVYEGTQEFQTRLGRSVRDIEFRAPTSIAPTSIGDNSPDDSRHDEMSGVEWKA